jgi:tetratricopeptide (TPR) repeat protein
MSTLSRTYSSLALVSAAALSIASSASATPAVPAAEHALVPESAVGAKYLPPLDRVAQPDEQPVLDELAKGLAEGNEASLVPVMDAALKQLREPTELRGLVQFYRAGALLAENRHPEAIEAIEESIRLLPGYSGPLLAAASVYAYANQPSRGADYLLRASNVDPDTVRRIDDYEVNNLVRRLTFAGDRHRVEALSDRLLEIGWIGSSLDSRSSLAVAAIERRISDGDVSGAKALIPKLLVPAHSYGLLVDKEFSAIWPDIETWAGTKLERQWEIYLREARDRWSASRDTDVVLDYTRALIAAGHDRTVIREILPLFYKKLNETQDQQLQFVVSSVAGALGREGRSEDAERLFERAQQVWPLRPGNPNALNVTANWGRYLHLAGKHARALEKIETALELARQWEVNPDAIVAMQHYRACILHELGRGSEAGMSMLVAAAGKPADDVAGLYLCTGNYEAARRTLVEGLESPEHRRGVLLFVQKSSAPSPRSEYGRKMEALIDRLKADPAVLAPVEKYGRVLPFSLREGAPAELP